MTDFSKLNEEELISLLQQDKLGAFREIYTRYWKVLYAEAYQRLKSKELSEEIVQELFTAVWHKRYAINVKTTLGGYLYSSVSNLVIDYYRKELVRLKYKESLKVVYSEADTSTEDAIMLKDMMQSIESEVNQLPDKCRSVYELSRIENKTNKEIAQYLGISEKTVENHLTKALKRLRLNLGHYIVLVSIALIK